MVQFVSRSPKEPLRLKFCFETGGFINSNLPFGKLEDNISMMRVENGEEFFGSSVWTTMVVISQMDG